MSISFDQDEVVLKMSFQQGINRFLFVTGSLIVLVPFFNLVLTSVGFIFGKQAGGGQMILSIFLSALSGIFLFRYYFQRYFLVMLFSTALIASVVFVSYILSSRYVDLSYDGQSYHQTAIIELRNGWNPFTETLGSEELGTLSRWLNHYPKGPWINSVSLYEIFGNIESAKLLNLVYAFASLSILLSLFMELKFSWIYRITLPLLIAFNPVVIYQSMSFYIDGQLYTFLIVLCVLLWLHYLHQDKRYSLILFSTIVVLVNIKFTAVVYSIIALLAAIPLFLLENHIQQSKRVIIVGITALIVGVFFIGFSPYVKNIIGYGNPFHPLAGAKAINIRPGNIPENYFEMGSFRTLIHSIFSESDNDRGEGTSARLKFPFTIHPGEWSQFSETNPKEGGFGPLYSGALVLSIIIIVLAILYSTYEIKYDQIFKKYQLVENSVHAKEQNYEQIRPFILVLVAVFVSAAVNPISSLARYVPQAWMLAIIPICLIYVRKEKAIQLLSLLVILVLMANNVLIAKTYFTTNLNTTDRLRTRIEALKEQSNISPLKIYFGELKYSTKLKLDEANVKYEEVRDLNACPERERMLIGNVAYLCKE